MTKRDLLIRLQANLPHRTVESILHASDRVLEDYYEATGEEPRFLNAMAWDDRIPIPSYLTDSVCARVMLNLCQPGQQQYWRTVSKGCEWPARQQSTRQLASWRQHYARQLKAIA